MAPQFLEASRTGARTKKGDPCARCFSKVECRRRKSGSGAETGGSRARQRASVSGGLGAGGMASDDGHEVIIITDDEEGSDEVISVSGSDEEEEEPCDYRLQTAGRFEPKRAYRKGKNGGASDKMESRDFQSDDDLIGCGEVRSFGEQGEGNGRSFGSEDDDYAQNVSRKNTPSVTEDPEADLSSDYLASSTKNSTEADDSSDEDFVASMSENLSTDGETSSSSEEYVSWSEHEENLERRKKRKREHKGESSKFYSARNNKKLAIDCKDDPMFDDVGRKENVEHKVSWVNEWLLDDVEEEERGHFRAPEEDRLNQSREKSTSQIKVSGVDRRMEEKRYGKHVQSGSNPIIQDATSSKVEGRKERDFGMSCSSQQLQKKRKHEDCSSKKASANEIAKKDCRANWKSRTRRERTSKPWINKLFVLADCLWDKDELLQDDIEKENAEKDKQCAGESTVKEERKESTECGIMTKLSEEGLVVHQAKARKDSRSTRDYGIR